MDDSRGQAAEDEEAVTGVFEDDVDPESFVPDPPDAVEDDVEPESLEVVPDEVVPEPFDVVPDVDREPLPEVRESVR